jgi:hypothetical protein
METSIRNTLTGGKPDRKSYHPMISEIHTKQSIRKAKVLYVHE